MTTSKRTVTRTKGWIVVHPDGTFETDYFQRMTWCVDGRRVSREVWRKTYRPECHIVRATLTWED